MSNVRTLVEMEEHLKDLVRTTGKKTAIIGGHFPVERDYQSGVGFDNTFGVFPQYTWGVACDLARLAKQLGKERGLVLIVDDHSLMPDRQWYLSDKRGDRTADEIRENVGKFFADFRLPQNYQDTLAANGLSVGDLVASASGLPYQESRFREQFEQENPGKVIGCAGEYEFILRDLVSQGIGRVIGMIPERCKGPTCQAVMKYGVRARNDKALLLDVTHVYLPTDSEIQSIEEMQREIDKGGCVHIDSFNGR